MNSSRFARRAALAAGLATAALLLRVSLAAYPEGPFTGIVAYAAGVATKIGAQAAARRL